MKQDSRVLSRQNARELTVEETMQVAGGIHTGSRCSLPTPSQPNGDGPFADCGGA
jgi:hypothetical protein